MNRILVVDDEPSIVTLLDYTLKKNGFEVQTATDGIQAYQVLKTQSFDFIILDVMLPQMSGMDICRRVREKGIQTPILMLTARGDEYDKIIGLELGADDYMTKPFSPNEVVARIKAILRRSKTYRDEDPQTLATYKADPSTSRPVPASDLPPSSQPDPRPGTLEFGDLRFDLDKVRVYKGAEKLDLTPKEYELLLYMAQHQGKTLSRDHLLAQVWQFDYMGETRIVDVHISKLRDKIETNSKNPAYLITVRGFGYRFEVPNES